MIDPWNRVMNNLLIAEKGVCKSIVCNVIYTPPTFPALGCECVGASDTAVDMENSENGITSVIRIRSFSTNGLTDARKAINIACDAMRQMGYVRTFGPEPIPHLTDFNIRCMEARFRRVVCDGDVIPKFDEE
jgi:hypothetical protein